LPWSAPSRHFSRRDLADITVASEDATFAEKPHLFLRYTALALRQRLNEGTQLGMALEGLTAADLAYQSQAASA
jgi:hypothetical protein